MSDSKSADNQHGGKPALRGDLTQGPILRTLIAFTIPTLAANVLQTLGGTVNTIWVGQLLGEKAVAATATANMVMFLAFAAVIAAQQMIALPAMPATHPTTAVNYHHPLPMRMMAGFSNAYGCGVIAIIVMSCLSGP